MSLLSDSLGASVLVRPWEQSVVVGKKNLVSSLAVARLALEVRMALHLVAPDRDMRQDCSARPE